MMWIAALLLAATVASAQTSRQLTASAEALLQLEKRIAVGTELSASLYEDVLTLLDSAIEADPENAHAHALEAGVLLVKSDNGDGTFDVCYLLDARDEANAVLGRTSRASASDAAAARAVLHRIVAIPPTSIPDPPSSCDEREDQQHGSKTRLETR